MKQAKKRYYTIRQYFREKHIRERQLSFQLPLFLVSFRIDSLTAAYTVRIIKSTELLYRKGGLHMLAVNYTNLRENMKNYMDKVTDDYETDDSYSQKSIETW